MLAFVLGVIVGALINLVTALFSREKALKLIPWLVFYVLVHASFVVAASLMRTELIMSSARRFSGLWSYVFVMLIGAGLAGAYWRVATVTARLLDSSTTSGGLGPSRQAVVEKTTKSGTAPVAGDDTTDPSVRERARRCRLRKDLVQYLTRGGIERDTFRILLQPTVDEAGRRVDPTAKLGEAMLRIQAWNTEVTFYLHSRLGEDYALWFMNKPLSERYPGNIGDVPGLSRSWDSIAGGVAKVEQLLRDFPELPGGPEATRSIENDWATTEEWITWDAVAVPPAGNGSTHSARLTIRPKRRLESPIIEVLCASPIAGLPVFEEGKLPMLIGNARLPAPDTFHFETLQPWLPEHARTILISAQTPVSVRQVRIRFWDALWVCPLVRVEEDSSDEVHQLTTASRALKL